MGLVVGTDSKTTRRRGRRGRGKHKIMSEINVTPMVDVMLVLLIIFMVSAPLLVNGIPLDLPKSEAQALMGETKTLSVSLNATGQYAINDEFYDEAELLPKLKAIGEASSEGLGQRIIIRVAADVDYARAYALLVMVNKAGFTNVALASQPIGNS